MQDYWLKVSLLQMIRLRRLGAYNHTETQVVTRVSRLYVRPHFCVINTKRRLGFCDANQMPGGSMSSSPSESGKHKVDVHKSCFSCREEMPPFVCEGVLDQVRGFIRAIMPAPQYMRSRNESRILSSPCHSEQRVYNFIAHVSWKPTCGRLALTYNANTIDSL